MDGEGAASSDTVRLSRAPAWLTFWEQPINDVVGVEPSRELFQNNGRTFHLPSIRDGVAAVNSARSLP